MCDIQDGQVIVAYPREDQGGLARTAAEVARIAIQTIKERYRAGSDRSLDELLRETPPRVWESSPHDQAVLPQDVVPPFAIDLLIVHAGDEMSFVDELRTEYFAEVLRHPEIVPALADDPYLRLAASPNWKLYPAAGVPEAVPDPFSIVYYNHWNYLELIGLHKPQYHGYAREITVAVLDNGFNATFWQNAPSPTPVGAGYDLIVGDSGTSGHGTMVAALVASSAPEVNVVPVRMAGQKSTEFDTLHALARAVQLNAEVITLSYSQSLWWDRECEECGVIRKAARSEVLATMVGWASDQGRRAILAAAGNKGWQRLALPAAYKGAIPIAALDTTGNVRWPNSNWDGDNKHMVLALPGEDVASSITGNVYSGTSFATAYAAALYAVAMGHWGEDASSVTTRLVSSARCIENNLRAPSL